MPIVGAPLMPWDGCFALTVQAVGAWDSLHCRGFTLEQRSSKMCIRSIKEGGMLAKAVCCL